MNNKYSKENVRIGDRVLLNGGQLEEGSHWGTAIEYHLPQGVMVVLDEPKAYPGEPYKSEDDRDCYYAYWAELVEPAQTMVEDERVPLTEDKLNISSNPLQKVIDDLTTTHRYLERVTGKKYSAHLQGFDLESGNGYDSNEVTIKFLMEAK